MENAEAAAIAAGDTAAPETAAENASTDGQPAPDAAEVTAREAIERAFAKVDGSQEDAAETTEVDDDAKDAAEATDDAGKSDKADEAQETKGPSDGFSEPPSRFSADAKQAWKDAPLSVRAEVDRAMRELEGGIDQYRQAFEPYREFAKQLQQNGQRFEDVLGHYTGIENKLAQDPVGGLEQICQNMGLSLRQVAEHVLGQTPDQNAAQQEHIIRELRGELQQLKQTVSGVSTTLEHDKNAEITRQITDFASDPKYARFDELAEPISKLLTGGLAQDLPAAYAMAERLNPAPVQAQPPAETPAKPADTAQTRKTQLSMSGAPGSGSNPADRKPSGSTREALDNAFAAVGL